jgi:hypothetical protein
MRLTQRIVLVCAVLLPTSRVTAQQTTASPHGKSAFGFSYLTYSFDPEDGVFTDNKTHATQNFGFRFTKAFRRQRPLGWLVDGELFLGVIDRELLNVPLPETIFGLHAFVGPQYSAGRMTYYAAGGVNRTSVPATELVSASRASVIQYVGRGGLSRLWAAQLNAAASTAQPTVQASIPAFSKVAPAGMIGLAYDFGNSGGGKAARGKSAAGRSGLGFRISADFLPVFISPARNNFRTSISITG